MEFSSTHPKAEKEIIDTTYFRLASKYPPDVSRVSNAAERMKQANIAYKMLSDSIKRAAYDAPESWLQKGYIFA